MISRDKDETDPPLAVSEEENHCQLSSTRDVTNFFTIISRSDDAGQNPDTITFLHIILGDGIPRRIRVGNTRKVNQYGTRR